MAAETSFSYVECDLGKELMLVWEVGHYQLDIIGLTSMHRSGTKLLDRGWTLSFSGVAQGEQAGVGILTNPRLDATVLEINYQLINQLYLLVKIHYRPTSSPNYSIEGSHFSVCQGKPMSEC